MSLERPWSQMDYVHLLTEVIKATLPDPNVLMSFIVQHHLYLRINWNEVVVPYGHQRLTQAGRTLNQCMAAYDDYERVHRQGHAQPAPFRGSFPAPTMSPHAAGPPSNKRPHPSESQYQPIQPKPQTNPSTFSRPTSAEHPPKKRRGRPPKAEVQARAEAAATPGGASTASSTAETPPVPTFAATPTPTDTRAPMAYYQPPPPVPIEAPRLNEPSRPSMQPTTRVAISSIVTPTTTTAPTGSRSSSGSERRRRGRSTRPDLDDPPSPETSREPPSTELYRSPYRMGPQSQPQLRTAATSQRPEDEDEEEEIKDAQELERERMRQEARPRVEVEQEDRDEWQRQQQRQRQEQERQRERPRQRDTPEPTIALPRSPTRQRDA